MGKYINKTSNGTLGISFNAKKQGLIADGAKQVDPKEYVENMVCIVDNGFFAAAAYVYSEKEFKDFSHEDGRHKEFFVYDKAIEFAD